MILFILGQYAFIHNRDKDKTEAYEWIDKFTPVNYFNMSKNGRGNKYGLMNMNTGEWLTKNSLTFEARGLCSRAGIRYNSWTELISNSF